jgi:hypothetical protein
MPHAAIGRLLEREAARRHRLQHLASFLGRVDRRQRLFRAARDALGEFAGRDHRQPGLEIVGLEILLDRAGIHRPCFLAGLRIDANQHLPAAAFDLLDLGFALDPRQRALLRDLLRQFVRQHLEALTLEAVAAHARHFGRRQLELIRQRGIQAGELIRSQLHAAVGILGHLVQRRADNLLQLRDIAGAVQDLPGRLQLGARNRTGLGIDPRIQHLAEFLGLEQPQRLVGPHAFHDGGHVFLVVAQRVHDFAAIRTAGQRLESRREILAHRRLKLLTPGFDECAALVLWRGVQQLQALFGRLHAQHDAAQVVFLLFLHLPAQAVGRQRLPLRAGGNRLQDEADGGERVVLKLRNHRPLRSRRRFRTGQFRQTLSRRGRLRCAGLNLLLALGKRLVDPALNGIEPGCSSRRQFRRGRLRGSRLLRQNVRRQSESGHVPSP